MQGNVDGPADVGLDPFLVATDVQDDDTAVAADRFKLGEISNGIAA